MNKKGFIGDFGSGFISDIILKVRLTINLLKDTRINSLYKLIPIFCLIYLIIPLDFLFGPVDDAVVIYFGMDAFISLCPAEIVQEYRDKISGQEKKKETPDIIEAEFKDE
jgi:hypothetical protein